MTLPRWTAYPALAVIAVFLVTAIPKTGSDDEAAGAARAVRESAAALPEARFKRIVVLGIDGLDPEILAEVLELYPERMQNFQDLADDGGGVLSLGTSTPPQSPVAWSNFITGRNPGGHGIFDFLHRDPETYGVASSTVTAGHDKPTNLPGKWEFPPSDGGDSNRTGKAFWTIMRDHGVPADVYRMPINFPVEPALGVSFPGMLTPAVDSAYGEASFYTSAMVASTSDKVIQVQERSGRIRTQLLGPNNPFKDGNPREVAPLDIFIDRESQTAALDLEGQVLLLQPGEWSDFVSVNFSMLPMGAMDMAGVVRFYLRSVEPEFELYASPINVDPRNPINPVSAPPEASAELADAIGTYYTQGMAEDVNSLKAKTITDEEFMAQANLVYTERGRMLDYALDRYTASADGGLLFFYYSTVDLCGHMMWRHTDQEHPFHDHDIAAEDSSWWSGREGSTWKDVVHDLYLKMDPVLGKIRERVGEDTLILVMSDHGFAPYNRKFSLNTWLWENGYLVLQEGLTPELPEDDDDHAEVHLAAAVDWTKTRAYGMGFNGLYLNLAGRESQGIVQASEVDALLTELKAKLEAIRDDAGNGSAVVVPNADLGRDVYQGERLAEAPDILVGYNSGYGNSDEASLGRIPHDVLSDNLGGTFNGSHLMDPRVVSGTLLTNGVVTNQSPRLEDLTVELLRQYQIEPDTEMDGRPVFE